MLLLNSYLENIKVIIALQKKCRKRGIMQALYKHWHCLLQFFGGGGEGQDKEGMPNMLRAGVEK